MIGAPAAPMRLHVVQHGALCACAAGPLRTLGRSKHVCTCLTIEPHKHSVQMCSVFAGAHWVWLLG